MQSDTQPDENYIYELPEEPFSQLECLSQVDQLLETPPRKPRVEEVSTAAVQENPEGIKKVDVANVLVAKRPVPSRTTTAAKLQVTNKRIEEVRKDKISILRLAKMENWHLARERGTVLVRRASY